MVYTRIIKPSPISVLGSLAKDINLPDDAQDTISSVSWSPVSHHLAAASWDGKVRIYDVATSTGAARGIAMLATNGPMFDCDWAKDGTLVVAGGADSKAHLLHAATGQTTTIGAHAKPIRSVRFVSVPGSGAPILATGSWDRTVKYWDIRQRENPAATIDCGERVYAMDSQANLLVVATAARKLHLVDLRNPGAVLRTVDSTFEHHTRAVAVSPSGKRWAVAGLDGRCEINNLEDVKDSKTNFTFRCHRTTAPTPSTTTTKTSKLRPTTTQVWAINAIKFHPTQPTVAVTAGSDGSFCFWDLTAHSRLKVYPAVGGESGDVAITAVDFSADGAFLAYASGYDWSAGAAANSPEIRTRLALHRVGGGDLKAGKA